MPMWCHMFNSTVTGNARVWFEDLPQESIYSYDDLKKAFLENYLQQKNALKTRSKFTTSSREMRNPRKILRGYATRMQGLDEMMRMTTSFLRGEVAASNRERKKSFPSWKQQEAGQKQNFKKGGFRNQQRSEQKQDRFRSEVRNQMVPATTPLVGVSREIIWLLRQISLLVKIDDEEHSTFAWMNFVVRSPSPYNGIIGRPGVRRIQAVPSTAHEMLKFLVTDGMVTLQSNMIILLECTMVSGPGTQ
ncbi:reverse transcriptase domain-containing protein [Tanacetum coccineum]